MTINSLAQLPDRELIDATGRAAADERRATVELLALLGEVDARRLYLAEGFSSLFVYCTQELKLSEHEAYHRIEAARTARAFPIILVRLRERALTLTSVTLLRPNLTPANAEALIANAMHKTRREVEQQMAAIAPKPAVKPTVRRLPDAISAPQQHPPVAQPEVQADARGVDALAPSSAPMATSVPPSSLANTSPRSKSTPLSSDRYLLRVTLSADAHATLQRARDLLRHSVPDGDPAAIVERALTVLVEDLERRRVGRVNRPRKTKVNADPGSRHIAAAVRREVWARDRGQCAYAGRKGRCRETGGLEFHHAEPFALGGNATAANIELRCRAHNQYEGALLFGPRSDVTAAPDSTRSGPS